MKKHWVIVGAIGIVLLLVSALLMNRSQAGEKSTALSSLAGGAQSPSGSKQSTSATGSGGTTQSPPALGSAEAADGGLTAGTLGKDGKSQSPATPQVNRVPLKRVALPASTVAFIDAKKISANSTYTVTFVPFGTGPTPKSLVISISESKPIRTFVHPFNFVGTNVFVDTTRLPARKAVTKGGTYTGTIALVQQGDVLVPMLIGASPTS